VVPGTHIEQKCSSVVRGQFWSCASQSQEESFTEGREGACKLLGLPRFGSVEFGWALVGSLDGAESTEASKTSERDLLEPGASESLGLLRSVDGSLLMVDGPEWCCHKQHRLQKDAKVVKEDSKLANCSHYLGLVRLSVVGRERRCSTEKFQQELTEPTDEQIPARKARRSAEGVRRCGR
jgi:hypothetical protein